MTRKPTREAIETPIIAPLFRPELSGEATRPLAGAWRGSAVAIGMVRGSCCNPVAARVGMGTAGRSSAVEVDFEAKAKVDVEDEPTAPWGFEATFVVCEWIIDVDCKPALWVGAGIIDD